VISSAMPRAIRVDIVHAISDSSENVVHNLMATIAG
jgi:hypothetical protein